MKREWPTIKEEKRNKMEENRAVQKLKTFFVKWYRVNPVNRFNKVKKTVIGMGRYLNNSINGTRE